MPQSKSYPEEVVRLIEAARKVQASFPDSYTTVRLLREALEAFPKPWDKPSPSPWSIDDDGNIRDKDHRVIGVFGDAPERLVNGRLMAAAPELLEACQATAKLADAQGVLGSRSSLVLQKITAAIEKATGKGVRE